MTRKYLRPMVDKQAPLSGKVENDFNKIGKERPTQKNEGKRTPRSRNDREQQLGTNQSLARKGGANQGEGRRSKSS